MFKILKNKIRRLEVESLAKFNINEESILVFSINKPMPNVALKGLRNKIDHIFRCKSFILPHGVDLVSVVNSDERLDKKL